jgi:ribosome recycling factor
MIDKVKGVLDEMKETMDKAITHLNMELSNIRAGKAMPQMLDSISVDYYGSHVPLSQVANIATPDARTLVIQPWEKSLIPAIEKSIIDSNLGFNPQNDGVMIRINIPVLTEERRKILVKAVKAEGENGRITIRSIRKETNEKIKKLEKDGLAEDDAKDAEAKVQVATDNYIHKIEQLLTSKEAEIMHV